MSRPPACLAFDVFGTLVDWRGGVAAEGRRIAPDRAVDWPAFAEAWAREYSRSVGALRRWTNLDALMAGAFFRLAPSCGLGGLELPDAIELSTAWSRLPAWPDAAEGMGRLAGNVELLALTNANRAQLRSLAESSGLPFDELLSAEDAGVYKPDPAVYSLATGFPRRPGDVCMVAAHCFDLNSARRAGMRTALITREGEFGSDPSGLDHEPDYVVPDVTALADVVLADPPK